MNDLKDLLELALTDGNALRSDVLADPSADLARGRKLLARRTRRRMLGAVAGVATAAAVAVAVGVAPTATPRPSHPAAVGRQNSTGIRLVAYTGTQPPGYTVKEIPAGWVIQGSNSFSLVIAPKNTPNKNPDAFIGKLVVMQEAFDTSGASAQGWAPVHAAGHAAYYSVQLADGTKTAGLVIKEAPGRWLLVQTPTSLGWSKQQMVQFGLGITVLPTAQEGKG